MVVITDRLSKGVVAGGLPELTVEALGNGSFEPITLTTFCPQL